MSQPRRLGAEGSEVRVRFVEAAEALLREEGGAVSARNVAEKAGLKPQLLYYYFRTMDELLRAVIQRVNERRLARFEAAMASPDPLRALWMLSTDPSAAILATELSALANRREAIREEIVEGARQFRRLQADALRRLIPPPPEGGIAYTAEGITVIAASLSRMLVTEAALGFTEGHADALAIVAQLIDRFGDDAR